MKRGRLFATAVAAWLSLSACAGPNAALPPDGEMAENTASPRLKTSADMPEASLPGSLWDGGLAEQGGFLPNTAQGIRAARDESYVAGFAAFFDAPFSSPSQLEPGKVARYALGQLAADGGDRFETDSRGHPYVPRKLLETYVQEHFGIDGDACPVSCALPAYDADRDAYLCGRLQEGPKASVSVVGKEMEGRTASYTVRLEYPDPEIGEVSGIAELAYTFQVLPAEGGRVLQAKSATLLMGVRIRE